MWFLFVLATQKLRVPRTARKLAGALKRCSFRAMARSGSAERIYGTLRRTGCTNLALGGRLMPQFGSSEDADGFVSYR
jgi:hypothetical protein